MSDITPEAPPQLQQPARNQGSKVAITAVIATAIVVLACVAACTLVTVVFLINAPWRF
jgi:hypothetical protein